MIGKNTSGTFRIIYFLYAMFLLGIFLALYIYIPDAIYGSFKNTKLYENNESAVYVDRFYDLAAISDDFSVFIFIFMNLGLIFLSLGIPADRDTAIFGIILFLVIYAALYYGADYIINTINFILGKVQYVDIKNANNLPFLVKTVPIVSFLITILITYSRNVGGESGGRL